MSTYHQIQLSKNYELKRENGQPTNVLIFNETNRLATVEWIKRVIENNDGSFIVLDHNNELYNAVSGDLLKRNYYIENVNANDNTPEININPFDLAIDLEKSHSLFSEILSIMWDNNDKDISSMSHLIDAFVSCMRSMFDTQPEKLNMRTLKKMIGSINATCVVNENVVPLSDAIFANIKDQNSMPCKYYAMFKKATGDRMKEVAQKVVTLFDGFSDFDMAVMEITDNSFVEQFNFKTAIFMNAEKERDDMSCKLIFLLLNQLLQKQSKCGKILCVVDEITANHKIASLSTIIEGADDYTSFIVTTSNIACFMENKTSENYFRTLNQTLYASILVHKNENEDVKDCVATIIIPTEEISEQDSLF